jgi:hypothetical protein
MRVLILKQKVQSNIAYKLVIDNPVNKPSWIFFIMGIVECSFNFCHHQSDVGVFLGEGLDCMRKLFSHVSTRKPKRMLC